MTKSIRILIAFAAITIASSALAADAKQLLRAFDLVHHPKVDTYQIYDLRDITITQKDLVLRLDSGIFVPYQSTGLDIEPKFSGGIFIGHGTFDFRPPIPMERAQMLRFFESDSLSSKFWEAELFFSPKTAARIAEKLTPKDTVFDKPDKFQQQVDEIHAHLIRYDDRSLSFKTLRNIVEPSAQEYLLANVELNTGGRVIYRFDPTEREEVELYKRKWEVVNDHIELVCKYAATANETYQNLNGFSKERIHAKHYNADVTVEKSSRLEGTVDYTFDVLMSRTQLIKFDLDPQFEVSSITDSAGNAVSFLRWEDKWHKRYACYVFLDRPFSSGETVTLTFKYGGDVNIYEFTQFFASVHSEWCPRYGYRQPATFDITIRSPKEFTVSCSADKVTQSLEGRYLVTEWIAREPVRNVAFDISSVERHQCTRENLPRVDIFFSEDIHRMLVDDEMTRQATDSGLAFITQIGSNMKEQIADDIFNAIKLFNFYFGQTDRRNVSATETLEPGGTAYPGYLKLGSATWVNTDHWGWDRMFRSHEVAHQWWGAGVSYATYRDQWLSEALAEYSSLLYLQQVAGNDVFIKRLKDYKDDIFAGLDRPFTDNETVGAIALGYRNEKYGDNESFDLIVYKKGAFVLHMLRNMLLDLKTFNEDRFFNLMKEWYATYNGQAPTTADFQRLVEKHIGVDMSWFFNQWIYGNEIPRYEFTYKIGQNENGQHIASCRVVSSKVSDDFQMIVPIEIEFDKNSKVYVRTLIAGTDYEFDLPPMDQRPRKIRLNPFWSVLADVKQ